MEEVRVALITGATTGIGLATAKRLVAGGLRVAVTARAESLARLAGQDWTKNERVILLPLDITVAEDADQAVAQVLDHWDRIDVLINNAGVCYRAVIEHLLDQDERDQFAVNYLGPLHLIRAVLPQMRQRRSGRIINLSSVGGMMAMPTMGGYSASKFALEGASEALWYELKPWGIRVSLIEPGFVRSDSFQRALFTKKSKMAWEDSSNPYHRYYHNLVPFIEKMMVRSLTTPDDIARKIMKAINQRNPPLRIPVTVDAWIFTLLRHILPAGLYYAVLYRSLPGIKSWLGDDRA